MGWDLCLRTAATNGLIVHPPQVIYEHGEPWWLWRWLGKTPDLSIRALWQNYQHIHLRASRRNGWRSENFAYQYLRYVKWSLTCHKILWHGASAFTFHLMEVVLWIFIALKSLSPRPGLNPRPLGPVASTLTTKPMRQHLYVLNTSQMPYATDFHYKTEKWKQMECFNYCGD
jgi:hypothetical protein